jgi:hypothetical protein
MFPINSKFPVISPLSPSSQPWLNFGCHHFVEALATAFSSSSPYLQFKCLDLAKAKFIYLKSKTDHNPSLKTVHGP